MLLRNDGNTFTDVTELRRLESLRQELAEGGDFAAAARTHSDDSAAEDGGDRGWVKKGYWAKDIDEAAFALKAGDVSEVLEDVTHYRILKVKERKGGATVKLEDVRDKVVEALKEQSREKRVQGWIEQAKRELAGAKVMNEGEATERRKQDDR